MTFHPFALRFDTAREAELVAEALQQLRCDNAPDTLTAKRMRDMVDAELGRSNRR
jgi:hypothetical protein